MQNRDIIVIGASMGGIEAVKQVAANLPAGLPAAVFVVIHSGAGAPGVLPQMLDKAGPLPCFRASDGEPFERGRIYAAPPDRHLLLEPNCVLTRHGPRENGFRPAIDPLFRSAAVHFGGRVIGVVLTGFLNDGTAGLRAIKRCGGLAVVQDPADAIAPEMPRSALRHVAVDHCVPLDALGALLARLAAEPAGESPEVPEFVRREAAIAKQEQRSMHIKDELGPPSVFTCPDCHGALWEIEDGDLIRFRCHIGHSYTSRVLLSAASEEVEQALSSALRTHKERTELLRRMAEDAAATGHAHLAERYRRRAAEFETEAATIQRALSGASDPESWIDEMEAAD